MTKPYRDLFGIPDEPKTLKVTVREREPEEPKIEDHRKSDEQGQRQHVHRLDERVHVERFVQGDAALGCGQPFAEREQRHAGYGLACCA